MEKRRHAYSLLLKKGLIRVSLAVPTTADFSIQDIQDPYDCPETNSVTAALYRRPLPSTNLGFLGYRHVGWARDGEGRADCG